MFWLKKIADQSSWRYLTCCLARVCRNFARISEAVTETVVDRWHGAAPQGGVQLSLLHAGAQGESILRHTALNFWRTLLTHHVVRATKGLQQLPRFNVVRVSPARTRTHSCNHQCEITWSVVPTCCHCRDRRWWRGWWGAPRAAGPAWPRAESSPPASPRQPGTWQCSAGTSTTGRRSRQGS